MELKQVAYKPQIFKKSYFLNVETLSKSGQYCKRILQTHISCTTFHSSDDFLSFESNNRKTNIVQRRQLCFMWNWSHDCQQKHEVTHLGQSKLSDLDGTIQKKGRFDFYDIILIWRLNLDCRSRLDRSWCPMAYMRVPVYNREPRPVSCW